MGKPVAVRVASDDCVVKIGGVEYHTHEGEWVEVVPGITVGDLKVLRQVAALKVQIEALAVDEGATDDDKIAAGAQTLAVTDDSMSGVTALLQRTVKAWSWTDDDGQPYPQPSKEPRVMERLRVEELLYLMLVVKGEAPQAEKNA